MNEQKLRELVLYIADKCSDPTRLGKTKLNKILYYSDFLWFLYNGKSITDESYIKHQFGPVAKHLDEVIQRLKDTGAIVVRQSSYYSHPKHEYVATQRPDLSQFSAEQISLVDNIIEDICNNHTAKSISEQSHDRVWAAAEIGEELPYYTVMANCAGEITPEDMAWAKQEIEQHHG